MFPHELGDFIACFRNGNATIGLVTITRRGTAPKVPGAVLSTTENRRVLHFHGEEGRNAYMVCVHEVPDAAINWCPAPSHAEADWGKVRAA